ncbi:MAG: alginate biosynthesis protein AlgX [Stagnimonas sp.]|nr:alginate biosynthesis protein AlgX [Stagnimonas sp.]
MRALLLLLSLLAVRSASADPAPAPASVTEPRYRVETCCQLCPAASNRSLYNTGFLEGFATLVEGRDGWLFRSDDDLREVFGPDAEGYAGLRRFRDALRRRGTELVMVYQPTRGLMHADQLPPEVRRRYHQGLARTSYAMTLERFRKAGVVVPAFDQLFESPGTAPPYFFRGDHHWTPEGARRTAQLTAAEIKRMPVYPRLARKSFSTSRIGVLAKRGTLQKAASQLCGFGYPDQYVDRYSTGAAEGGDLFGEDRAPEITLVGTSNSDSAYNFAGFLSEYLGVEVLNESLAGGGFDGPLFRYLPSEAFQKSPPKILIWELQTYHNLSERDFYRRVLPLIGNGCAGRAPVLSRTVSLKGARTEALFNGGGQVRDLVGRDYQLDIRFDDPAVEKLKGTVWYADGSKDHISLENSPRVEAQGRFVVELRSDGDYGQRTFLSLDLEAPEGVPAGGSVKAQLCRRDDARPESRRVAALAAWP